MRVESNPTPSISVIMAVHNGETYIRAAVQSVLKQTFKDFELIVVDDGSTDQTAKMVSEFDDKRIKLIKNQVNMERSYSRNLAVKMSSGEYLAILDADDICLEERFEKQLQFMRSNEDVGLLGSDAYILDQNDKIIGYISPPKGSQYIDWLLNFDSVLVHSSAFIRREVFTKAGGYTIGLEPSEDYDLWCRVSNFTLIENISEPLVMYRQHQTNSSTLFADLQKQRRFSIAAKRIKNRLSGEYNFHETKENSTCNKVSLFNSGIIYLLYKTYLKSSISIMDRKKIKQDAASRIFKNPWPQTFTGFFALLFAFSADNKLGVKYLKKRLSRLKTT